MDHSPTIVPPNKEALLRDLLKQVSRLFYTTLAIVPANVRDQVSLAYLFARAADTIADTELIDRPRRLHFLNRLREQFIGTQLDWVQIRSIQQAMGPLQQDSAERILLDRQALHARRLTIDHPITGERMMFEAPTPHDLQQTLAILRRWRTP